MASHSRLLCCSKSWSNPLLWSHYSDNHKGIALVLEVPEKYLIHINYTAKRPELRAKNLVSALKSGGSKKFSNLLLSTKYSGWRYENEARVLFDKSETYKKGSLEFYKLSETVKITGLIVGPLASTKKMEIERNIPHGQSIQVTSSRLAFRSFRVVRNTLYPPITVNSL